MNLAGSLKNAWKSVVKHSPEILVGVGITGMFGTTILAVKATPKALRICEDLKAEHEAHGQEPTNMDYVKAAWKCYIPAGVTGVTSAACIIFASTVSARRNAALATAYSLSHTALTEYKDKVIETIGEKKEQAVQDAIAKNRLEKNPVEDHEVINTGRGNTLCYDMMFGRYFRSDAELIRRAINRVNRDIVSYGYASLNDFYSEIDLEPVIMGGKLGWNFDDREIKEQFSYGPAKNDEPCMTVSFNIAPHYDYDKFA